MPKDDEDRADERVAPLGERELATFAEKLSNWGENLPEHERVFLRLLVERANQPLPRLTEFDGIKSQPISAMLPRLIREYAACRQIFFDSDGGVWLKAEPPSWLRRTP